MAIYSRKYGRTFKSLESLAFHDWHVRRTSPIFSWFGLKYAPYSDAYRKSRGLPERRFSEQTRSKIRAIVMVWYFLFISWLLLRGCSL